MRSIDNALSVRDGRLFIEGCDATDLAKRFGTPIYVTSEDQVRRNLHRFKVVFGAAWPGDLHVMPSIKANASLAIRRILTEEGAGCDAFGPAELEAALRGGVPPSRISLNGPSKDPALLERAIKLGVRITLDSVSELECAGAIGEQLGQPAQVRLRLRPNYRSLQHPSELMVSDGSIQRAASRYKAGIPTEDLLNLSSSQLQRPGVRITGLMAHLGRHDPSPETWAGMAAGFVDCVGELLSAFPSLDLREVDIGGGLPTPRDPFGRADLPPEVDVIAARVPPLESYADAIVPALVHGLLGLGLDPGNLTLEIEPGRAMFADAGIHLTTVCHVKRELHPVAHVWVETDTSDAWLADTILERNRWTTVVANRADSAPTEQVQIVGRTCAPDIIVADERLAAVEAGDVIALLDTGAYQEASASNFNSLPRPATILVHGDQAEVIRTAETIDTVFARDVIPARLGSEVAHPVTVAGLDHVSVTTADIERSLAFYRDLLGLQVRGRGEEQGGEVARITGLATAHVRWADLHLPHGQILELLQYLNPPGTTVRPSPNDPGATHISLRVSDVDTAHARLSEAGVMVRSGPVLLDDGGEWDGARCFYAADPDGVTVELIGWAQAGSAVEVAGHGSGR